MPTSSLASRLRRTRWACAACPPYENAALRWSSGIPASRASRRGQWHAAIASSYRRFVFRKRPTWTSSFFAAAGLARCATAFGFRVFIFVQFFTPADMKGALGCHVGDAKCRDRLAIGSVPNVAKIHADEKPDGTCSRCSHDNPKDVTPVHRGPHCGTDGRSLLSGQFSSITMVLGLRARLHVAGVTSVSRAANDAQGSREYLHYCNQ